MLPNEHPQPGADVVRPFITIHFEDHGQDFLEWDCDKDGIIIDCRPFQSNVWCKGRVANLNSIVNGVKDVVYKDSGLAAFVIKYPVEKVSTHE